MKIFTTLTCLAALMAPAGGAKRSVPNASFEQGERSPEGWVLSGGSGRLEQEGAVGRRSASVTGDGTDSNAWLCEGYRFEPLATYRVAFWLKGEGSGGCAVTGTTANNRDFRPTPEWRQQSFVFTTPSDASAVRLRFGQWQFKGTVWFDGIELTRVVAIDRRQGELVLGCGERLARGRYTFESRFDEAASNSTRTLVSLRTGFNSHRLVLAGGAQATYCFGLPGFTLTSGEVRCNIGYHAAGACVVEASVDALAWRVIGRLERVGEQVFAAPAALFPVPALFVRFRAEPGASFQIYSHAFAGAVDGPAVELEGETRFAEVTAADESLAVEFLSLGSFLPGPDNTVELRLKPAEPLGRVHVWVAVGPEGSETVPREAEVDLGKDESTIVVPYEVTRTGSQVLDVTVGARRGPPLFAARIRFDVPTLHAADYGYRLEGSADLDLWWCEGTYKVSRVRAPPVAVQPVVRLEAARNEYEPVQVVIRPQRPIANLRVRASDLEGPGGARVPAACVTVRRVGYVHVTRPTDAVGAVGWWPDPLLPLAGPLALAEGLNQPLWITVFVPADAAAGEYRGTLTLAADGSSAEVPLCLRVFDFTLPRESHVRSAFGLNPQLIRRYHRLTSDAELRQVLDLYHRDFAAHRISPYDPMALDPVRVEFGAPGEPARLDWSAFDRAASQYLDGLGFNTFRLRLEGMGGGTFHSRSNGRVGAHERGTPEYVLLFGDYVRQVEAHLRERGWLDEAYLYWFDEPDPKDYAFVRDGMDAVARFAPGIRRMLTEQPEPDLLGAVDIWCPVLHQFDRQACAARQREGETIWWYVCTGPKGDYTTLFTDHPAVNLRMWLWLTWKYGVEGILVWSTNHWTSSCAFPGQALQNPYEDPMAYVSGYDRPAGYVGHWGNGDGRFLYPPEACFAAATGKVLEGPVDSFRWEMLREGIEDFEYLHLLKELVGPGESDLLGLPEAVCASRTEFTRDPLPLYEHRRKVAAAIEQLDR